MQEEPSGWTLPVTCFFQEMMFYCNVSAATSKNQRMTPANRCPGFLAEVAPGDCRRALYHLGRCGSEGDSEIRERVQRVEHAPTL